MKNIEKDKKTKEGNLLKKKKAQMSNKKSMDPKVFPPSNQTPTKNISSPLLSHFFSIFPISPPTIWTLKSITRYLKIYSIFFCLGMFFFFFLVESV